MSTNKIDDKFFGTQLIWFYSGSFDLKLMASFYEKFVKNEIETMKGNVNSVDKGRNMKIIIDKKHSDAS